MARFVSIVLADTADVWKDISLKGSVKVRDIFSAKNLQEEGLWPAYFLNHQLLNQEYTGSAKGRAGAPNGRAGGVIQAQERPLRLKCDNRGLNDILFFESFAG